MAVGAASSIVGAECGDDGWMEEAYCGAGLMREKEGGTRGSWGRWGRKLSQVLSTVIRLSCAVMAIVWWWIGFGRARADNG